MMTATVYPLCALFAWIVVLRTARSLPVIRHQPERLATWWMFVFFALIFTVGSTPVRRHLDGFAGITEFSTLLVQSFVVCYSAAALVLLQLWAFEPEQAARRIRATLSATVAVLATMTALFFLSDPTHAHNHNFVHWYGSSDVFDAYLVVYLATFTAACVETIRLCVRFARLMTASWLRTGLRTASVGAAIGLVYSISRLADIAVAHVGIDLTKWESIPQAGAGIGSLLVMLGMTMHRWGPRATALRVWRRRLRAYAELRPLWAALYARDPGIALDTPHHGAARWRALPRILGDLDYHVGRRVIEIRDGILALQPYLDPQIAKSARQEGHARGLTGDDLEAAVEAERIRAAITGSADPHSQRSTPEANMTNTAPADLDAEIRWLTDVSRHFADTHRQSNQRVNAASAR